MSAVLQDFLGRQAHRRPDAVAVVGDEERLTYEELDARTGRLATMLRGAGCRLGDRVGILIEKSPAAIAGILAALKVRCAYVPLDVTSPVARLSRIVGSADLRVLLVNDGTPAGLLDALAEAGAVGPDVAIGSLSRAARADVRPLAFDGADVDAAAMSPAERGRPDDLAYVFFTSGSTGVPKGVMVPHRSVLAFTEWTTSQFAVDAGDRNSGHAQLTFDLSTLDLYTSLAAGAELNLVPDRLNADPRALARFIRERRLTQWHSVPSVLSYMAQVGALDDGAFPDLKRVLWCGDVLPTSVLATWKSRLPHVQFTNLYGPTEATVASSFHTVDALPPDGAPIPIGRPCAGEEVFVADEQLTPLGPGEVGELCIAGVGLAHGYWRDEATTRKAFVHDLRGRRVYRTGDLGRIDEDGVLHFLGRRDSQIKHRGYRIELGEIAAALDTIDDVAACAVVDIPSGGFEATVIGCAYTKRRGSDLTAAVVRSSLERLLPSYMIPMRWLELDELPKNANGKIDRNQVRELMSRQRRSRGEARQMVKEPA
jgi:amino acid adenylation domain-containing protein